MLFGEANELTTTVHGHQVPGGILETGHDIDQSGTMPTQDILQSVDANALFINGYAEDMYAPGLSDIHDAEIRGIGGDQGLAIAHQRLQGEIDGLLSATRDQHRFVPALNADGAHIIADGDAQRQVTFRHFVGKRIAAIALDYVIDGILQMPHGKELFWRRAAAEIDDARFAGEAHHLAEGAGAAFGIGRRWMRQAGKRRWLAITGDESAAARLRAQQTRAPQLGIGIDDADAADAKLPREIAAGGQARARRERAAVDLPPDLPDQLAIDRFLALAVELEVERLLWHTYEFGAWRKEKQVQTNYNTIYVQRLD